MQKVSRVPLFAVLCAGMCLLTAGCNQKNQSSGATVTTDSQSSTTASVSTTDASPATTAASGAEALPENHYTNPTFVLDNVVVHAGDKHVAYRLFLLNNPGYANSGLRLFYDAALKAYTNADKTAEYTAGSACEDLMHTAYNNEEQHLLGFGTFGSTNNKVDGVVFTCYFDIPADAKAGTVYKITGEKVDFKNLDGAALTVDFVAGAITVA